MFILGILCGSEPDQQSLNNRQSNESLDSGETEQSEGEGEECMEIVETTSMDEDYRELQLDLCLYPQESSRVSKKEEIESQQLDAIDDKKIRYRELNMNKAAILKEKYHQTICVPIDFEEEPHQLTSCDSEEISKEESNLKDTVAVKDPTLFKSFFFKNAIFRTAQSIIENHEKKNTKCKESYETNLTANTFVNSNTNNLATTPTVSPQQQLQQVKKRDFSLKSRLKSSNATVLTTSASAEITALISPTQKGMSKSSSTSSLTMKKIPGTACLVKESVQPQIIKTERGQSGLLRFFESPVFNIHFAIHYLFYSKEPGVLTFIGNKIFSFPHADVDNYIPQLILMYMQIDELAEVLDPYLVYRCRKSADFSLRCGWLLEAYNFNNMEHSVKFKHLSLMRELYRDNRKNHHPFPISTNTTESPYKKTHHRSQSDATGRSILYHEPPKKTLLLPSMKLCLGDLSSGRAFDNGCVCFESQRGAVNDLLGQRTVCSCGAPKLASEREFMKSLIDIGKTLTMLPTKIEKMSRLRVLLNLINKNLPARVWLPLNSDIPHHVVRITEEKTAVLNSKDRTPYIIYVEVVTVDDIYTSQVIPKMMPTLRHTKSDEHLDQLCDNPENNSSSNHSIRNNNNSKCSNITAVPVVGKRSYGMSRISSNLEVFNDDEVWSQEDDEITAQYLRMTQNKKFERDTVSQISLESCDSTTRDIRKLNIFIRKLVKFKFIFIDAPESFNIGDVRNRHCRNLNAENTKPFKNDPDDPSAAALKVRILFSKKEWSH